MAQPLKITFSARPVIAVGYDFSPHAQTYSDPDVALDEIQTLRVSGEPSILRVQAVGGNAQDRKRVSSEWLCDIDGEAPRRIPAPKWTCDPEARTWSKSRSWLEAWETCPDARWLLHAAAWSEVDPRYVVRAASACARTLLVLFNGNDLLRARRVLELAEEWAPYRAIPPELERPSIESPTNNVTWSFGALTRIIRNYDRYQSDKVQSKIELGAYGYPHYYREQMIKAMKSDRVSYAASAAYVADTAASAAVGPNTIASDPRRVPRLRDLADIVRGQIPTLVVLRAACTPHDGGDR